MKRTFRILSTLPFALLLGSVAHAKDLPPYDASFDQKPASLPPGAFSFSTPAQRDGQSAAARAADPLSSLVASRDPRTNVPTFVWGTGRSPAAGAAAKSATGAPLASAAERALAHITEHAALYGLSREAIASARVAQIHDTGRGGVIVVLRQEMGGVPLYQHDAKVLLHRDGSLAALSGSLSPLAVDAPKAAGQFALPHAGAVARALSDLYSMSVPASALAPSFEGTKGQFRRFDLASSAFSVGGALRFDRPARARKVYFAMPDRLVPAYHVELFSSEKQGVWDMYSYVVAADDGRVLQRRNLTAEAAFKYRVWADEAGDKRPLDGPLADFTPHPTGVPDGSYPAFIAPSLISIDGFNKNADPWLADGATDSRGNNADAYTDHDDSNNVSGGDVRATVTAPGEFDLTYDTSKAPLDSVTQQKAAVTQLFYTVNWLHDYWYDSGFDEAAGNAQVDNYGRGGEAGDPLRAEAQDAVNDGASNNANMSTPDDGESPRMQMYIWDGRETRSLDVEPLGLTPQTGTADFGPPSYDVTGEVVLVDDGVAPVTNGCEAITNDVTGKIALIDRGDCPFEEKTLGAQNAGAIGVILANNQGGQPPFMPGAGIGNVTIPIMSVSQSVGNQLKTGLQSGAVTATLQREAGVDVDGTIDNLIVAHEWGHYLHHRLVSCGLNQCGAESEGWGDFLALTTQLRPGDDLDGTFSDAVYATVAMDDAAYFGTRRMPYTTDMSKNPLTFQHIQQSATLPSGQPIINAFPDNAEVHNAGEVWSSMLFEGFVALLQQSQGPTPKYTFDEARRRMADYVVAGLKLAPTEPTFTEQRDAIIAAAYTLDPDDALLVAQGFAKRGAGSCAESPPKDSFDNEGVVESFVVAPAVSVVDVKLDDSADSCDDDGLLDAGETGKVVIQLANRGYLAAPGTTVKVSSITAGVTFPGGQETSIAEFGGFAETTVSFEIAIDPKQKVPGVIDLTVTAENAAACNPSVVKKQVPRVNYDNKAASSTKDDFESDLDVWTPEGDSASEIWSKGADEEGNHLWHGVDYSSLSDTWLSSPSLSVSDTGPLVLTFKHRYTFETSTEDPFDPSSPLVYWDGSVIEVSSDGGSTWVDVATLGDPGYTGQIGNLAENPLSDREGYVGQSAAWPDLEEVKIDLGSSLAGKSVQFRFRIGSDQAASEVGWEIDDVAFEGIEGAPFPTVIADAQSCSPVTDKAPIADAGPDQAVDGGDAVTLDASKSSDPDGDELSFTWQQVAGPNVTLTPAEDGATAAFTAPAVEADTTLTFIVSVSANGQTVTDSVNVLVHKSATDPLAAEGGGCGCSVPGDAPSPAAPLGALASLALALTTLRRRPSKRR